VRAAEVQRKLIRQVTNALDAPAYRVTVMSEGRGINLTRPGGKETPEQPVDAQGLEQLSPTLARFNAQGWNVYITPLSDTHHFLVVDDLRGENQDRFAGLGYRPALVQETSPGNQQAVLRVPVDPANAAADERSAANAWVRQVNLEVGDPKFTGAVHPFRLAGFTNRKDAYQQDNGHFPFVRVLSVADQDCDLASAQLEQMRHHHQGVQPSSRAALDRSGDGVDLSSAEVGPELLEAHRRHRQQVEDHVEAKGWVRDESKIDFHVAHALLRDGYDVPEVAQAIRTLSPELDERHRDAQTYAERTALAAAEHEARLRARSQGPDIDR
jgi:hypothetical protein